MTKKISRRTLLKGGVCLGAAAGLYSPLGNAKLGVPTIRSSNKVVVIGSGFGGSIATLRLAQAGIPVTLVERGRNWAYQGENTFPTLSGGGDGTSWRDPGLFGGSTGLLEEFINGSEIVGCGAGLGGGSLVYGGVLLQPLRELFEQALPQLNYDDFNNIYYPRVLSHVSGGPIPDDILNSPNYTSMRVFIKNATATGLDVVRSEVGFNWNIIREEIEGKRTPFASVGEWVYGCNSGAKNTLDRNYIADANATGNVEILTLHNVSTIVRTSSQTFEVHCDVLDQSGKVIQNHIIECQYLFMAAGSINTTKLLLKAKALGDLPTVNDGVGQAWATNGDELMIRRGVTDPLGYIQAGPPAIAAFDLQNPIKPVGFMHAPSITNGATSQQQMGMCIPDKTSTVTYSRFTDRINLNWSKTANSQSNEALLSTMNRMAAVSGGKVINLRVEGTWHPVGGAAMGVACSYLGELNGTPNLYVIDGALIPGSSGAANPSLTIGANAERIMETLVSQIT
jgi:cholesterol oxidase